MALTTEEKVDSTFDCIDDIKKQLREKGTLSFKEIDTFAKQCNLEDINFVFGNMSFDSDVEIDYSKSEVRSV